MGVMEMSGMDEEVSDAAVVVASVVVPVVVPMEINGSSPPAAPGGPP